MNSSNARSYTIVAVLAAALAGNAGYQIATIAPPAHVAYFSPRGGCEDAICQEIIRARKTIRVLAYSFTSKPIAGQLIAAHDRGVDVQVILDASQVRGRGCVVDELVAAGVFVAIDGEHAIAHNKVIVFDGKVVITGSYNFSAAAESRNAENLLVVRDVVLARRYEGDWLVHFLHSERCEK